MKTPPTALADQLVEHSEDVLTGRLARLEDVAAAVGTSRARLYYYFSGVDDLRGFLLDQHTEAGAAALVGALEGVDEPVDRLRAAVVALTAFLAARPGLCLGFLAVAGESEAALRANDAVIAAPLRALVAQAVAAGDIRPVDPADTADAIVGAILMAVVGHTRRGATPSPDLPDAVAELVLRGVVTR